MILRFAWAFQEQGMNHRSSSCLYSCPQPPSIIKVAGATGGTSETTFVTLFVIFVVNSVEFVLKLDA
jgi:hypothetical protein